MILIQEQSPTGVTSVTFSGIGGTYRSLYLLWYGSTALASTLDGIGVQFNGDTAANYAWQKLRATAAVASATEDTSHTYIDCGLVAGNTAPASSGSSVELILPGYASTTFHKVLRAKSSVRASAASGGMVLEETAGFWLSTAAITSILVADLNGANFNTGTKVALYGMP